MQPQVPFILVTGALQPRIAVQMTDHPTGIHLETRRDCLRMQTFTRNGRKAVIHALKDLIADKAGAESLRTVKLEVITFRLRMAVRQVAGPIAAIIKHFTKHHVGVRRNIFIKNRVYAALCNIAELTHAGIGQTVYGLWGA